jgi:hypothetical protein
MDARDYRTEESLFIRTTPGGTWEFVTVRGRGCALLRDGERVAWGDSSAASVERVLGAFFDAVGDADVAAPEAGSRAARGDDRVS